MTTSKRHRSFVEAVRKHAKEYGRTFPWRDTVHPYRILVSEIMLQQTQTERVVPKYRAFLKKFPTVRALARAPLRDVLHAWSGLGYNRRAKLLHACAKEIADTRKGKFPETYEELVRLPGVGPYTAGAVLAFAFNAPHPVIETNIRTVYLRHFFPEKEAVTDREILALVEATLDRKNPRAWYAALMDYGAHLKATSGNENRRSKNYTKQSTFKGSSRELRGKIIRSLLERTKTERTLLRELHETPMRLRPQLQALIREGVLKKQKGGYAIVD